jgi:hypothetical protein
LEHCSELIEPGFHGLFIIIEVLLALFEFIFEVILLGGDWWDKGCYVAPSTLTS